jgi:hypothetical protein
MSKSQLKRILISQYCLLAEANKGAPFCADKAQAMKDINLTRLLIKKAGV